MPGNKFHFSALTIQRPPPAEENVMDRHFRCPKTNLPIVTNMPTTFKVVQENWSKVISQQCPHCTELHAFQFREAFVDAVLRDGASGDLCNSLLSRLSR